MKNLREGLIGLVICIIAGIAIVLDLGVGRGAWEPTIFLLCLLSGLGYMFFFCWDEVKCEPDSLNLQSPGGKGE